MVAADMRNNPDFVPGYIHYLPINGAVIAPQFGDAAADKYCKDLLTTLYPGRVVEQLNIDPITAASGLHTGSTASVNSRSLVSPG